MKKSERRNKEKLERENQAEPKTAPSSPPPQKQPRATSHGILCPDCSSGRVRVTNTKTYAYPAHMADRLRIVNRRCVCCDCERRWWAQVEVTEKVL